MTNVTSIVDGLEHKIRKLIEKQRMLQAMLEDTKREADLLRQKNEQQTSTINQLEEKLRIIKLTKTVETKEGTAEAKARINELVREIDKCIRLLNT